MNNVVGNQFTMKTPGYAIVIAKENSVLYQELVGLANVENNRPITNTTAFRLASNTKPFTAMAIMILAEKGFLSYEDTICSFFLDFPSWGKNLTIRQLLSHISGMPDHEKPLYQSLKTNWEPTIYDALAVLKKEKKALFQNGERYQYSDAGFVVLALIIEKVSKMRYAKYMQKEIFQPLGMKNTVVLDERKPSIPNQALGYKKVRDKYVPYDYDPLNYIIGDEGIYSTALDLLKWTKAWNSEMLVSRQTLAQALQNQNCISGKSPCGFSWFIKNVKRKKIIFHEGEWVGFTNLVLIIPESDITLIFLSNTNTFMGTKKKFDYAWELIKEHV